MNLVIKKAGELKPTFSKIWVGDTFRKDGAYYIKVSSTDAFNVDNNQLFHISLDSIVIPKDHELTIES